MNENAVIDEGFFMENPPKKTPKNLIPDAKYYLIRAKDSRTIYITDKKPDYEKEPFYESCVGSRGCMYNYLLAYSINHFNVPCTESDIDSYLILLGIYPIENSVSYVFDKPKEVNFDEALTHTDSFVVDSKISEHYRLYDWHIPMLLNREPFKGYIQENYQTLIKNGGSTVFNAAKEVREVKELNKRLLI